MHGFWGLLSATFNEWTEDKAPRLGAATVYLPSSDGGIANQKEQRKQDHQPVQLAIFTGDEA